MLVSDFMRMKVEDTKFSPLPCYDFDTTIVEGFIKNIQEKKNRLLNKLIEETVRVSAVPPIKKKIGSKSDKGDITEGKLRWRGIKLCSQTFGSSVNYWVEQRGERISHVVTFTI